MRIHLAAGLTVALLGTAVAFPLSAQLALAGCVFLVLSAEVANSALEALVDLVTRERHPLARAAKDAGAGAVLVLAVASVVVLGVVLAGAWPAVAAAAREQPAWVFLAAAACVACAGALLLPSRRRWPADVAVAAAAWLALAALAARARSVPFAALAAALLAVACATALRRARRRPGGP